MLHWCSVTHLRQRSNPPAMTLPAKAEHLVSTEKPLITTIIPTYQRPLLLKRAILSAVGQDGVARKICVYDNASEDGTRELVGSLAEAHQEIEYFCHPANIGGFANFQFGLSRVDTPYFNFLSDDDLLLPGFYSKALADLTSHPDVMMWAGTTVRVDHSGRIYDARLEGWPREGIYSGVEGLECMTRGRAPIWTGVVARSKVLQTVGLLDEEVGSASDLDWILRIAAQHQFFISKIPVAILTLHDNSYSENAPLSAFWPGWLKMIQNILAAPTLSERDRNLVGELLCADAKRMLFRRVVRALAMENYDYAKDATRVQKEYFRDGVSYRILTILRSLCMKSSFFQNIYARIYHMTETALLKSRQDLRKRHGHLAQHLQ
jgi:GT2 family glycosyltransferase